MPKFRSKPVVIEATQFRADYDHYAPPGVEYDPVEGRYYVVTIHEQRCYIENGDWIIPEPDGVHFYPVKPDIFARKYEEVEDQFAERDAEVDALLRR